MVKVIHTKFMECLGHSALMGGSEYLNWRLEPCVITGRRYKGRSAKLKAGPNNDMILARK